MDPVTPTMAPPLDHLALEDRAWARQCETEERSLLLYQRVVERERAKPGPANAFAAFEARAWALHLAQVEAAQAQYHLDMQAAALVRTGAYE